MVETILISMGIFAYLVFAFWIWVFIGFLNRNKDHWEQLPFPTFMALFWPLSVPMGLLCVTLLWIMESFSRLDNFINDLFRDA